MSGRELEAARRFRAEAFVRRGAPAQEVEQVDPLAALNPGAGTRWPVW